MLTLQKDLHVLLGWAQAHGVELRDLQAGPTRLDDVFRAIDSAPVHGAIDPLDPTLLKRLLPGGSATELTMSAWTAASPWSTLSCCWHRRCPWVVIAVVLATRLFRWEPRR